MMGLLQALQALAIDAMLPALGQMAHDLGSTDPNERQLVVAIFLLGIGAGALFPGPLADRYGRRPVLFTCLALYIVPAALCALVHDMTTLLVLRFIQAAGSAGLAVIPAAIIRDRFEGDRMARLQSLISVIFMTVPMIAPTIGQVIMETIGWRWIFGFMAIWGAGVAVWAWLRLPESLNPANRQLIRPGVILGNMGSVLATRGSIGYVLGSTLLMGASWGYINSSQQLVAEHFGVGANFPYLFGAMAICMMMASFTNSRIVERFGARRVSHTSLLIYIAAASLQLWLAYRPHETIWQFAPVMTLNLALMGFMGANFGAIAIQPFARTAGAAASIQGFVRTISAGLIGAAIGQAFDGSARPLAWALLIAGVLSLVFVLFSERGQLFRRVYPRGSPRPDPWRDHSAQL